MPKIQQTTEEFLAQVEAGIFRATYKARQNREAYRQHSAPDYWDKQRQRRDNPKVRSYDALTDWIVA